METASPVKEKEGFRLRAYIVAALLVAVSIAVGLVLRRLPHANLSLVFLLAVLIVAAIWGFWPSILSTVLSFLALNFFFTVPLYSFTVEEEGDLASIVFFLAMAALTANLAARMRNEMSESRFALSRVSALLDFSGKMSSAVSVESALRSLMNVIANTLRRDVAIWLPNEHGLLALAAMSTDAEREIDVEAVSELLQTQSNDMPVCEGVTFFPLELTDRNRGVVAVIGQSLASEERKFADGLCEQASLAVERILLVESLEAAQVAAQTEQLRSALLSSVSHDLRTPLASIIGSVSSVLEYHEILKQEDQRDLLQTVLEDSQRLNRYIQNLLDMTRLGQRQIELKREWVDLNDLVSAATKRLGAVLKRFNVTIEIAPDVALLFVHGALIEQVLVNILDNAIDFSESGDVIRIRAYLENEFSVIDVIDRGPGIPEKERERVFEMFYMAKQPDDRQHGVGLGLAICKSIVEAHGGVIEALPGPNARGTCMRVRLSVAENAIERGNG